MNALSNIIQDVLFNLADPSFKYCVFWVMHYVAKDAVNHFITSSNYHRAQFQVLVDYTNRKYEGY